MQHADSPRWFQDRAPATDLDGLIIAALAEDLGPGDVTTEATIPAGTQGRAVFRAKAEGGLAGLPLAEKVFAALDPAVGCRAILQDGARVRPGDALLAVDGPARPILTGERTALNLVQYLSGIATRTSVLAGLIEGTSARLVDTRKTLPGYRALAKYAVRCGGGSNHRFGLGDGILIKDNHIAAAGSIAAAVKSARRGAHHLLAVEVEVEDLLQLDEALSAGADAVLLDNMDLSTLREAVIRCRGRAVTEASGGVTELTIRAIAETGVDLISVGALTHSVTALDISLDWD